jgi:hypothetical protein
VEDTNYKRVRAIASGLAGAAGDRGYEQNFVSVLESVSRPAQEPNVLFVNVNVEEAADLSGLIAQMGLKFGKLLIENGEQFSKIRGSARNGTHA